MWGRMFICKSSLLGLPQTASFSGTLAALFTFGVCAFKSFELCLSQLTITGHSAAQAPGSGRRHGVQGAGASSLQMKTRGLFAGLSSRA